MWKYITSISEVTDSLPEIMKSPALGMDTETRGLNPFYDDLLLVQIATPTITFVYDARYLDLSFLFRTLEEFNGDIIFHNSKFDLKFLNYYYGFTPKRIFDTMIAETLITCGIGKIFSSLNDLSHKYFNVTLVKEIRDSFQDQIAFFTDQQLNYAADDAEMVLKIYPVQKETLVNLGLERVSRLEFDLVLATARMEIDGIGFSRTIWSDIISQTNERYKQSEFELRQMIQKTGGIKVDAKKKGVDIVKFLEPSEINLNSPAQIMALLKRFSIKATATGEEQLSAIDHPFVHALLKYRKYSKRLSAYGERFLENISDKTGRIHAQFNQIGTVTGRFSSDSPNMQNIPNPAKDRDGVNYRLAFVASEGNIMITSDYSQVELRILAEVSNEPKFLEGYRKGQDLHTQTATLMYHVPFDKVTPEQRAIAKNTNFAIAYGSGAGNLTRKFRIPFSEAETLVMNFHKGYPVLSSFLTRSGQNSVINHYSSTLLGRRRNFLIPSMNDPDFRGIISSIKREGTNHIIQGTSADMTKAAMLALYRDLPQIGGRLLITVHDEIVSEVPEKYAEEGMRLVKESMEKAGTDIIHSVPIIAEAHLAPCWSK